MTPTRYHLELFRLHQFRDISRGEELPGLRQDGIKSSDCADGKLLVTFFRPTIRSAGGEYSRPGCAHCGALPPVLEINLAVCEIVENRTVMQIESGHARNFG